MKFDRLNDMEQYIRQAGATSLEDLRRHYRVSMSTIRRDVAELIRRKRAEKVYGGVTCAEADTSDQKQSALAYAEGGLGRLAAALVAPGMSVFLDSGTAGLALLPHLAKKPNITVISHCLSVLSHAARFPGLNVIALGGIYNSETASFCGKSVLDGLAKMSIDLVFLSADGVTFERGLTCSSYTEMEVKKNVAKWNRDLVLLAQGTEFGSNALITFCELGRLRAIVSETAIPPEFIRTGALRKTLLLSPETAKDDLHAMNDQLKAQMLEQLDDEALQTASGAVI